MMCDRCGEEKASVHKIQMSDGEVTHLQLCNSCADDGAMGSQEGVQSASEILSSFEETDDDDEESTTCSQCGMTLDEFRSRGRVGCAECYLSFEDEIEKLIHRVHGADRHVGSGQDQTGLGKVSPQQKKQILEKRLQEQVEKENYEDAAELRDRIEEIEDRSDNE